jgi:rRNA maturation protein Nop10
LQRGDNETFEETFAFCCPKFVNPIPPPFDPQNPINIATEAQQKQLKMFMSEVDQQVLLPTVRSYLKLYTTMPIRYGGVGPCCAFGCGAFAPHGEMHIRAFKGFLFW